MKITDELAIHHALFLSFHPHPARENSAIHVVLRGLFSIKYVEHRTAKMPSFKDGETEFLYGIAA